MIKLSQCMIVKNEEANIEKALSWAKDVAYEQIVVDTGSTDRTVEIAEKMGAKVYHFKWIDDFAAAKNYALSKATGDWIAFLDADEYFEKEDAKKLMAYLEELKDSKYVAMITSMLHLNDNDNICMKDVNIRVFRNIESLKYSNAIHECLVFADKNIDSFSINLKDELAVFHTGYAESVSRAKKKGERNIRLLLKEIEKDPENRNLMGYLSDAYFAIDDYEETKKWSQKAVASLHTSVGKYDMTTSRCFQNLIKSLSHLKEEEILLETYEQAVQVVPEESDFDYFMSFYWMKEKKDFEKALLYLERAFRKLETNRDNYYGQTLSGELQRAWETQATCYFELQNWTKCIENCIALLQADAYRYTTTIMLLKVFQMDEQRGGANARTVLQFLSNLYPLQSLKNKMYLLKVATKIHYDTMVLEIRNLFTSEELAAIDSSIGK